MAMEKSETCGGSQHTTSAPGLFEKMKANLGQELALYIEVVSLHERDVEVDGLDQSSDLW